MGHSVRRLPMVALTMAFALAGAAGCNPEVRQCDDVDGQFQAQYTYLPSAQAAQSGLTGCSIGPYLLTIDGGSSGVKRLTTRYGNQDVITNVTLKGCTVGLDVTVNRKDGTLIASMAGDMEVVNANLLSGTVQGRKVEDTGYTCNGFFRATLSRQAGVAGGSAPITPPPAPTPVVPPTVAPQPPVVPPAP